MAEYTQRYISMRAESFKLLKDHSVETGIPMAKLVTRWSIKFLDDLEAQLVEKA